MSHRYWAVLFLCIMMGGTGLFYMWTAPSVGSEEVEIYRGVYYRSIDVPDTEEGSGQAHLVRVDLSAEGVHPFITPIDSSVVDRGAQYRLRFVRQIARWGGLAVAVNGTGFRDFGRFPLPRRTARSVHTVISEGTASHIHPHSYMIWGDSTDIPYIAHSKPPPDSVLEKAQWGIGGSEVMLRDGVPRSGTGRTPDRRTVLAIDSDASLLWLATFEDASFFVAAQLLAEAGAQDAIPLDGGGSTALYIGSDASNVSTGYTMGGWRPVATHMGVYAEPL